MTRTKTLGILLVGVGIGLAGIRPASAEDREARGTATAVSDTSLTVKVGERDMTFVVSPATQVEVTGAGRRTRQAGQAGATAPTFSELISSGRPVLVTYHEANGKNQAVRVRPISSPGEGGGSIAEVSKLATGKVTSISAKSLTLSVDGKDRTFALSDHTNVRAKGAGTAAKAAGGTIAITELVATGDTVSVTYQDVAGAPTASDVRITVKAR